MPLTFSVKDTDGTVQDIGNTYKITSVAGLDVSLFVSELKPIAIGERHRRSLPGRKRSMATVEINPLVALDEDTLQPEYGTAYTVKAQVQFKEFQKVSKSTNPYNPKGPDNPSSYAKIYFLNADKEKPFPYIFCEAKDSMNAEMYAGLFTVELGTIEKSGENEEFGLPATSIDFDGEEIAATSVDLCYKYEQTNSESVESGDAVIVIPRLHTRQYLTHSSRYFSITPLGQDTEYFSVWNGKDGIKDMETRHWMVHLKKMRVR